MDARTDISTFVAIFIAAVGFLFARRMLLRRRKNALREKASKLGLRFNGAEDYEFPKRFAYLSPLNKGNDRCAENVFSGSWQGHEVLVFDYRYVRHGHLRDDSDGLTSENYNLYLCHLPREFPRVSVEPRSLSPRWGGLLGMPEIQLDSAEFAEHFTVHGEDKKLAYDICHARMMACLLERRGTSVQIERDTLAMIKPGSLQPDHVEDNLERLIRMRELLPEYLFNDE